MHLDPKDLTFLPQKAEIRIHRRGIHISVFCRFALLLPLSSNQHFSSMKGHGVLAGPQIDRDRDRVTLSLLLLRNNQ